MTQINKMVLEGFKSFAKRTELLFGNGFNVVLGPNGSGKSNILDALCFVLGRLSSKSMRVEKSANLIYNGGKTKKPADKGEVSIYFDNSKKTFPTEDPEVKITRIIKQDGQSIYKINDKKRTRQQVVDLLSIAKIDPDGYNIILQGDIVKFTEMHPEERRKLIEEIAGISIYEDKKQKALNELAKVEEKLKEADIVLAERKTYLNELKKDRDQALKFKELRDKITENKASYLWLQIKKKKEEQDEFDKKIGAKKEQFDKVQAKINEMKAEIEKNKQKIDAINKEIEQKGEQEQVAVHKEIEQQKVELATTRARMDSCRNEIARIRQREKQLKTDLEELEKQAQSLNSEKAEFTKKKEALLKEQAKIEQQISDFKKKHAIEGIADFEKEIEQIDKEIEEKEKEAQALREKQQTLLREKDYAEVQISSIDEKIEKVLSIERENRKQIEELKTKKEQFKKDVIELNKALNEDSMLAQQISDAKCKLANAEEKLAALKAACVGAREGIAGSVAVKKILEQKERIKGIYGTINELGRVSSKYALALEIAAGPRISSIVVENDKVAAECIHYLKENKLGTAIFLPLNKIKERELEGDAKKFVGANGVHGIALDLISFEQKFKKAFGYVFGDTLVVDNIDVARRVGIGTARMVTIDGDLCEASGAMQGGYRLKKRGVGFVEKEIMKDFDEQQKVVDELHERLTAFEKRRAENEKEIDRLRQSKAQIEGEVIKIEKSLHLESSDLDATRKTKEEFEKKLKETSATLDGLRNDIIKLNSSIASLKTKKQELKTKISELKSPIVAAQLNAFEERKTKIKEELVHIDADIKSTDTRINDMIAPEKAKISDILKQQKKELENFNAEIEKLAKQIGQSEASLRDKEEKAKAFYASYKELFAKRDSIGDEVQQIELKIESARQQERDIEIKMNNDSIERARIAGELAGLQQEFAQYEGVKICEDKSEQQLKSEIEKFEKMAADIGSVNMRALEVYDDIEKEYNSLLAKKDTLVGEKDEVLKMMAEIEGKKTELFMKSFNVVNENFKRIFSELGTKGEASLELENPEKPFEGGLDIKVRIAGKKFLDIRSLSGGEKTLTALAFIFAIQEYEPHSFYVLDEVDAALDKHNSEKLAKLVKKYVEKAQYLMITHNDAIISEGDNLYGVSMNEHGISTVVSLRL